ncbi:hypothetical protein LUZ60_012648 [Juncus effusus]|nr:hypothetical protein LUZ60_012648 [Juncus effusus]
MLAYVARCYWLVGSVNLFTPPPTKPAAAHHHHHQQQKPSASLLQTPSDRSFIPEPVVNGAGYGTTIEIKFCASCSYRGTAVTMKKMLETSFPGIHMILQNYPPTLPKRLLSKLVPVVQFGTIIMITAGDQIFPRLGMAQLAWFLKLRANKFGAITSTWLFGNFAQSILQSSGAFEVYSNGELNKLQKLQNPAERIAQNSRKAEWRQLRRIYSRAISGAKPAGPF